jgi:hypothetical protein
LGYDGIGTKIAIPLLLAPNNVFAEAKPVAKYPPPSFAVTVHVIVEAFTVALVCMSKRASIMSVSLYAVFVTLEEVTPP